MKFTQYGQVHDSICFQKGSVALGIGIGQKSHLGNFGFTLNYFFLKNFSIKTSIGLGMLNFNGGILSVGPEYEQKINKKIFWSLGVVYSFATSTSGGIETHNINPPSYVIHSGAQYIRSSLGFGIRVKQGFVKFEFGCSYIINKPTYSTGGQWESKYTEWLEKGLGSGILWGVTYRYSLGKLKK